MFALFCPFFAFSGPSVKLPSALEKQFRTEFVRYQHKERRKLMLAEEVTEKPGFKLQRFRDTTRFTDVYRLHRVLTDDLNHDHKPDYVIMVRANPFDPSVAYTEYYFLMSKKEKYIMFPSNFYTGHCPPDESERVTGLMDGKIITHVALREPNACCACIADKYTCTYRWNKGKTILEAKKPVLLKPRLYAEVN